MAPAPPTPAQRRLLAVSAGLGVAALAVVMFTVTYGDLKALVIAGHAPKRLGSAYPIMFDILVVVTILALVMARHAPWWARWPRWLLLALLLAGAGAAGVQRAVQGYDKLPTDWLKAGVAAAPHLMLVLAVWLWLGMFRHARRALARRTARRVPAAPAPHPEPVIPELREPETEPLTDLIPGFGDPDDRHHQPVLFPDPVFTPEPAPPRPLAASAAEPAFDPEPASHPEPAAAFHPAPTYADPPANLEAEPTLHLRATPVDEHEDGHEDEDEVSRRSEDRAEDPDADDDLARWSRETAEDVRRWAAEAAGRLEDESLDDESLEPESLEDDDPGGDGLEGDELEATPPSSKFRSSPTPPGD